MVGFQVSGLIFDVEIRMVYTGWLNNIGLIRRTIKALYSELLKIGQVWFSDHEKVL
jgi:hypothetical protein